MLSRLWKQFISWIKTAFGSSVTIETLIAKEHDMVTFARKHFEFSDERLAELDQVRQFLHAKGTKTKILVQVSSDAMMEHIAFLSLWLAKKDGICIGFGSPNLPMSYQIRRKIDEATKDMSKPINNRDTILFDNNARIDIVNQNRFRGKRYDVVFLNATEHVAEPYLGQYTKEFGTVVSQGGYVLAYCEDFTKVKTTYFPGWNRLRLTNPLKEHV